MIAGILLLIFILWLSIGFNHETKAECTSGHKWVYGQDDRLICSVCNKRPGEDND